MIVSNSEQLVILQTLKVRWTQLKIWPKTRIWHLSIHRLRLWGEADHNSWGKVGPCGLLKVWVPAGILGICMIEVLVQGLIMLNFSSFTGIWIPVENLRTHSETGWERNESTTVQTHSNNVIANKEVLSTPKQPNHIQNNEKHKIRKKICSRTERCTGNREANKNANSKQNLNFADIPSSVFKEEFRLAWMWTVE